MDSVIRSPARTWLILFFGATAWVGLLADPRFELGRTLQFPFDVFGRSILAVTLHAAAASLLFAGVATVLSTLVGTSLGLLAALRESGFRTMILVVSDFFLALPSLLFALAWSAIRGPGWDTLLVSICLGSIPGIVRTVYGVSTQLNKEDFVLASRSFGAHDLELLKKHHAPEVWRTLRLKIPNLFASALLAEATLGFLGVGAPRAAETWGSLLSQGRDYIFEAPHIALISGLPLALTLWSLQRLSLEWGDHESTPRSP